MEGRRMEEDPAAFVMAGRAEAYQGIDKGAQIGYHFGIRSIPER